MFNLQQIKRIHQHFLANLAREIDQVVKADAITRLGQRHASQHGKFKSRTGNLVRRTQGRVIRTGKGRLVKLVNTARYAAAQDLGSGLHGSKRAKYPIRPRRAKALRFIAKDGTEVITKLVMHPGVKPTKFLYRASYATGRTLGHWLLAAMQRAAKRFR